MINPLALETIVHPDLLPFERPFVLAHEWAHLSGHADEAEASAIGWLACMRGGPELAYSANLYLIDTAGGAMPADLRKEGNHLDLAIAIALLAAYGALPAEALAGTLLCGELGLDGSVRPVRGGDTMRRSAAPPQRQTP